jgi:hypothetical protein
MNDLLDASTMLDAAMVERFWAKVERGDGCWLWTACIARNGYGQFGVSRRRIEYAHRISFCLAHGRWPSACVLHRCDVRNCVNPAHLFEGTHQDNYDDMARKGRRRVVRSLGEAHGMSKLTSADVTRIWSLQGKATKRKIANLFGVDPSLVGLIHRGKIWTHVTKHLPQPHP